MKRKILVVTGSRSEYGILRSIIKKIHESKKLKLYVVAAGMHLSKKYGLTINEIKKDGFPISGKVYMIPKGNRPKDMAEALGKGIISFSKIFHQINPNVVVVLGDRDEALSAALASSHMNIPVAHIHGGDKSQGGIDEYNRHAITKISNLHFAATPKSKERILKMGENPKYVFYTGSPSIDEIKNNSILSKEQLEKKYHHKFSGNEILLLFHPVTTEISKSEKHFKNILSAIAKSHRTTFAVSPNSDAGNFEIFSLLNRFNEKYDFVKLFKNVPRSDFLGLMKNVGVILGNSSSAIIESSYFGTTAINVGIRQQDRERDKNVIDVSGNSASEIFDIIEYVSTRKNLSVNNKIYGSGNTSSKIIQILETIHLDDQLIQKQISY